MTNVEFQEWKLDPRTKEVMKTIEGRCYDLAQGLAKEAGLDPLRDRLLVGYIRGLEDMLRIEYEETQVD